MTAPLNIQPNPGAQGNGVASFDTAGNETIAGSLNLGGTLRMAAQSAAPIQTPGSLTLYTTDGNNLSGIGANGLPAGFAMNGATDWFNVKAYGAKGDGTTDDATAINAALTAAGVNGGVVYLPAGTYAIGAGLVVTSNVAMVGDGMDATIIKPKSGALYDAISTPIPAASGNPGFIQSYIGLSGFKLDCSNMTGTTNGIGNGIHFYGVRYSYIRDVWVNAAKNWSFLLDGDTTNFGYNIEVKSCIAINGAAGIMANGCEANFLVDSMFLQANATMASTQPSFASPDNVGYLVRFTSGYNLLQGCVIGSSGTYTSAAVQCENSGPTRIVGNRFDQCRSVAIRTTAGNNVIVGNQIGNPSSVDTAEGIRLGSQNNIVANNIFDNTNGAAHYTYCIREPSAQGNNTIVNNRVNPGTTGTILLNAASTGNHVSGNVGYNPVGSVTPPAVPATTVTATNNFGTDATVYVVGTTVTAITVSGVATGAAGTATGTAVRVPSGSTIALTYASGTPTWTWFLD